MSTNEEKVRSILEAISADIIGHEKTAEAAMNDMERTSLTSDEYKSANLTFGLNCYVAGYLNHIKEKSTGASLRHIESVMRFHAHFQRVRGNLTDGSVISTAQAAVTVILEGYIQKFFEA